MCICCHVNLDDSVEHVTHFVDLHSVGVLQQQEFAPPSDQTGDGVDHLSVSTGPSWDLFKQDKSDVQRIIFTAVQCFLKAIRQRWIKHVKLTVTETLTGVSLSPPPPPPLYKRSWRRVLLLFLLILLIDSLWYDSILNWTINNTNTNSNMNKHQSGKSSSKPNLKN